MVEREGQHSKAFPHDNRKEQEQEPSHDDFHQLHPAATPTRAQQQRHRRNLRLNGQVDVEKGSLPRHTFNEDRRESWIDRINSSTRNAIRRTSVMAAVDEKKLIDKVADSINDYGDQHKDDSWTDKVMSFLFPSMGLEPSSVSDNQATTPSDVSYDQMQQNELKGNRRSWAEVTAEAMNKIDKNALNQHPGQGMKTEASDQAYDDAQAVYPKGQSVKSNADDMEEKKQPSSSNQKEHRLGLDNKTEWPPL